MRNTETTEDVVEHAYHAVTLVGWSAAGIGIGLVVALVSLVALNLFGRKSKLAGMVLRRTGISFSVMMGSIGAWVAYAIGNQHPDSPWYGGVHHVLLLVVVGSIGWYLYRLTGAVQDLAQIRIEKDRRDAHRLTTQAQVFQRVLQAVIIVSTFVAALLTFPATRAPLASLLASAGVLSVIVGFAAQNSIANMFAGMQLAFTDAIRVGDMVSTMMASKEKFGTIEEITLTYVIIRLFNDRNVLVPSSDFTSRPFENWTLHSTEQLGFIEMEVDWSVPVARVRRKVHEVLLGSDLWDHRRWNVQVTEAVGTSIKLRIVISAANPGDRWDLECEVREKVVSWLNQDLPWAVPRVRVDPEEVHSYERDLSKEQIAELAEDLLEISGKDGSSRMMTATVTTPSIKLGEVASTTDPIHAAKVRASRRKAQKARRRSIFHRHATDPIPLDDSGLSGADITMQITDPTLEAVAIGEARSAPRPDRDTAATLVGELTSVEDGTRMFSGSPAAEKNRILHAGPGEEVMRQREETTRMRALDAQGKGVDEHGRVRDSDNLRETVRVSVRDFQAARNANVPRDSAVDHGDGGE